MTTIRARLTAWYAAAITATILIFGAALYHELQKPNPRELDYRVRLQAEAATKYLQESHRVLGPLVDHLEGTPSLNSAISPYFESVREYLVLVGRRGELLYLSEPARELSFAALERLTAPLQPLPTGPQFGRVTVEPASKLTLHYLVAPVDSAGADIGALLVATPYRNLSFDPGVLLNAMLVSLPIVLLASGALGWWLAGAAMRPVEGIIDELEAITDGRTLHRRIVVPAGGDEIRRLGHAVNAMLARLEQSFASLRRFTADASHELKTPLMVLRAGVERTLTHPKTPAETLQTLDETLEQVNQMSEMVESLLTLARADEGRAPLALEDHDLRDIMTDIAETAGILGEEGGLTVTTELPDHPVRLAVDAGRIRELLLNLATNAVKYTPAGGRVELGLADGVEEVTITVRDTGIGIAPGDLPHIFERFWRADPARSRTGERAGTGLGLAITKWIAEAHGGTIGVQSRPGRGTVFTVVLPKTGEPAAAPPRRDAEA
ncbi:MAG TPA: ATP-binding protein [Gemmatimonadales bacterium]|nr:ATP-binding protein [Gemmatimonadales bacterium]